MSSKRLSLLDASFLYGESGATMMHIGGMATYIIPGKARPGMMREMLEEAWAARKIYPPFNYRLKTPEFLKNPRHSWIEDDQMDISYHVRRSSLPSPGDERELGILVSRLHSNPLDFHRPPWEMHLIEGLEGNRFATYFKMHHSLIDGITSMKMMERSMSTSPDKSDLPFLFAMPPSARPARKPGEGTDFLSLLTSVQAQARSQLKAGRDVGKALLDVARAARGKDELVIPFKAPPSILNGRITRSRRFATQQFGLDRLKALAKASGGTLNDIILAVCAGPMRRFLAEMGELPDKPLVAMIPVNLRPADDPGGGNAVGTMLASLATDIADPQQRLDAIQASTRRAKSQLEGMSKQAIMLYSALIMTPFSLQLSTGTSGRTRPAFNVVISNVPGPKKKLYFRGMEMEASYPMSIPLHGQAFNITINSYADTLNFGFIGCAQAVPHLQRLALYTADAVEELEKALL